MSGISYWDFLEHSAKGTTWKNHKYVRKEGTNYIYTETHEEDPKKKARRYENAQKARANAEKRVDPKAVFIQRGKYKAKQAVISGAKSVKEGVKKFPEVSKKVSEKGKRLAYAYLELMKRKKKPSAGSGGVNHTSKPKEPLIQKGKRIANDFMDKLAGKKKGG